jgi:hypothetical protein
VEVREVGLSNHYSPNDIKRFLYIIFISRKDYVKRDRIKTTENRNLKGE